MTSRGSTAGPCPDPDGWVSPPPRGAHAPEVGRGGPSLLSCLVHRGLGRLSTLPDDEIRKPGVAQRRAKPPEEGTRAISQDSDTSASSASTQTAASRGEWPAAGALPSPLEAGSSEVWRSMPSVIRAGGSLGDLRTSRGSGWTTRRAGVSEVGLDRPIDRLRSVPGLGGVELGSARPQLPPRGKPFRWGE